MTWREWILILQWCVIVAFFVAALYSRSKRTQAVGEAGPLVLLVIRPRIRAWHFALLCLMGVTLLPLWMSALVRGVSPGEFAQMAATTMIPFIAVPMAHADAYVEARDRGIVCNRAFWPWGHIQAYEWLDDRQTLRLWRARYDFTDFRIAESQKEALDQLLRQNTLRSDKVDRDLLRQKRTVADMA